MIASYYTTEHRVVIRTIRSSHKESILHASCLLLLPVAALARTTRENNVIVIVASPPPQIMVELVNASIY